MDPATRRLALIAGGLGGRAAGRGRRLVADRPSQHRRARGPGRQPADPGEAGEPRRHAGCRRERGHPVGRRRVQGRQAGPPPEAPAPQALLAAATRRCHRRAAVVAAPAPAPAAGCATPASPSRPTAGRGEAPRVAPDEASGRATGGERRRWSSSPRCRSEDAAKSEWQRLSKRLPDLLGQRQPAFSKTEHDGRTLWRVRTGGFGDVAQATSFCERRARQGGRLLGGRLLKAAIVGIAGPTLSADEAALFRDAAAVRRHPVRAQHRVAGAACRADRRPAPDPAGWLRC